MESKVLNFVDAIRLAQILEKYVDTDSINSTNTYLDLGELIMNTIDPSDYSRIIRIFTKETLDKIGKLSGSELLSLFISGLEMNRIMLLLEFYKKMGVIT